MNGRATIVVLFLALGSWNPAFAQSRLDIRQLAGEQYLQKGTAREVEQRADANRVLAVVGHFDQRKNSRARYLRQLNEILELRQQNERLTTAEHSKLWLAGLGDVEKFMQSQEDAGEIRIIDGDQLFIMRGNNIHIEAGRPLFGAGSMLASVSKRLTRDDPEIREHRRQVAVAAEELLLSDLESVIPLTAKQHRAVLELLEKHRPVARYAHFRKHYVEAMECLLEHSKELRAEFSQQQLENFERMVENTETAVGKLPVPNL